MTQSDGGISLGGVGAKGYVRCYWVASARLILSIKSTKTPMTGKILIVEDNLDLLSLLHRVLRAEGYEV